MCPVVGVITKATGAVERGSMRSNTVLSCWHVAWVALHGVICCRRNTFRRSPELAGEKMDDQEDSSSDQTAPQPHEPNATPENGGTAQSLGAQSYEDAPNFASTSGSSSSSSAISGARFQRRGDVRRRRSDRRASPYATAAAAGGRRGGSSGRGGGEGRATQGRRTAPTPGETQVLMSLWGL